MKGKSMERTILILAANPKDTSRLRLDQEVREIDNGLQRARRRDEFVLKQVLAARPVDVRRAMLDWKPNIVHFCGHGAGDDGIAFEDETGNTKLVNAQVLTGFFELFSDKVECVVLNACYSEMQAEAIALHIEHVIGMKKSVGDTAAIEFAVAFYDALGAGESVEFAYKLACNAIQWAGLPEHLTPILKTSSEANHFLNKVYDSQEKQDFDQWTIHSSVGEFTERVKLLNRVSDGATTFEIKAFSTESVGVNKSLPMLWGRVEFEYKVIFSEATQPNVYFCIIPMQETGIGRSGLVEVGTNVQADPRNPYSPHRQRWYVPLEYYGDGQWHQANVSFDFRETLTAFYSIFASRINEGCGNPAPAHLLITNLQVFSIE